MGDPRVKVRVKVKVHKPFWQRHPLWFAGMLAGFVAFMAAVAVIFFSDNNLAAKTVAKKVLPVPAGPIAKVRS